MDENNLNIAEKGERVAETSQTVQEGENINSLENGNLSEEIEVQKKEKPERRCINCMAVLQPEDNCCPDCGAIQEKVCPNCFKKMGPEQSFCTACGANLGSAPSGLAASNNAGTVQTKKSNNNIKIIAVIAIAVVAVIAFFLINSQNEKKRIEEFKANAQKFEECVIDSAVNIEDIGDEILSNWNDFVYNRWSIYDSPDDVLYSTLEDMYYEVDQAEEEKSEIEKIHSSLKAPKNDSKYTELVNLADDLYYKYVEFYEFVTEPEGSYNSFSSGYRDLKDDLLDAYNAYAEYLDVMN